MEKKVFLITGGSSGIGLEVLNALSKENHLLISVSRSKEKIKRALSEYPQLHERVEFLEADISKPEDIGNLYGYLNKKYGVLHGLVNNAAVLNKGTIESSGLDDWNRAININLTGTFITTKYLLPLLKQAKGASVVNVSSVAGLKPGTSIAYSVSKAGLDMLTKFLAGDLGPYNIRVNSVNPGLVETNIHLDNNIVENENLYKEMLENARKRYPIGRIGKPVDIANMIVFLLSDKASWISGSIITADGGVMVENDLIPEKKL